MHHLLLLLTLVGTTLAFPIPKTRRFSTPRPATLAPTLQDESPHICASGKTADMMALAPMLQGHTLCDNWTNEATERLASVIDEFVTENPIVTGQLTKQQQQRDNNNILMVHRIGTHQPKLQIIQSNVPLDTTKTTQTQDFLSCLMESSLLKPYDDDKDKALFGMTLVQLPNNQALLTGRLSHSLGDGTTFFEVLKHISMRMSDYKAVAPIDWDHPAKATHQIHPPYFSKRDIEVGYGLPLLHGCARNLIRQPTRKAKVLLLNKHKVNDLKHQLRKELDRNDISANDVITSALIQANQDSDVFVVTENQREHLGIPPHTAGNLYTEVALPRQEGEKADRFRDYLKKSDQGEGWGQLPLKPFLEGRTCRITSLATIAQSFMYKDVKVLCSFPDSSLVEGVPFDVAMIFRYSQDSWGILHNFHSLDLESGHLRELLAGSES